jgi:hypothetical protein
MLCKKPGQETKSIENKAYYERKNLRNHFVPVTSSFYGVKPEQSGFKLYIVL